MPPNDVDTSDPAVADAAARARSAVARESVEKRAYVRSIFSQIAPSYDLLNHLLSFNIDRAWRSRALAALGWERRREGSYLDLCAGTLDVSTALSKRRGFAGHVIGADFAEPMLRAGRGKGKPGTIAPVVADALELPIADGAMAGAIVAFGFRNVADLDAALREVLRVLEPCGRFVILEFTTPRSTVVRALYHFYFHRVLPFVGTLVSGHKTAYHYLPRSVANFPIEEELASRMTRAGFANVHWRTLTFGVAAVHVGEKA